MGLVLAAAASSEAFSTVPSGLGRLGAQNPVATVRPALRKGVKALTAVYEPAIRIGHGFDIHRLGELGHTCLTSRLYIRAYWHECVAFGFVLDCLRARHAVDKRLTIKTFQRPRMWLGRAA
jgi:hypothetical protein